MATVKQAEFNTQNAIKSISDLKSMVKQLKSEMEQLTIGTDEYKQKAEELAGTQQQLNSVQQYAQKGLVALKGSYNAISYEMAELKKRYHETADAAERADLAKKIGGLNDQLKEMDANVGVFSRNVGNYQSAFESLGSQGLGGLTKYLGIAKTAMTALGLSAGWITLIVIAVQQLAEAFKRNTDAMDGLNQMLIPFKAVWIQIQRLFDDIVKLFVDLKNGAGSLGEVFKTLQKAGLIPLNTLLAAARIALITLGNGIKIVEKLLNSIITPIHNAIKAFRDMTGLTKTFDKVKQAFVDMIGDITKAWNWLASSKIGKMLGLEELAESIKQVVTANEDIVKTDQAILDIERKIRKAKEQDAKLTGDEAVELANLRDQYNRLAEGDKQRLELSKQIADIEHSQKKRAYDMAVLEYELIKKRNSLTSSNADDIQAEAEAYKAMQQALAALNTQTSEFYRETRRDAKAAATEASAADKERLKQIEQLIKQLDDWNTKYIVDNQTLEESKAALTKKYQQDLELLKDNEEAKKLLKKKYNAELADLDKKLQDKQNKDAQEALRKLVDDTNTLMAELIEQNTGNVLFSSVDKALRGAAFNIMNQFANAKIDEEQTKMLLRGLGIDEGQINEAIANVKLDKGFNALKEGLIGVANTMDLMGSKWGGVVDSMINTIGSVQDALKSSETGFAKWGHVAASACQMVGSVFSTLADEQDTQTEDGFEKQKQFQIAAATMNMLGGVISAWTSAMNPANAWMTLPGQIAMGTAMSAMILGTGIAQIAQIQKQTMKSSSSASASASPSASGISASIQPPVQYAAEVQGASQENQQQDTRVYVLENDITNTQRRVNVAENEARF